MDYRLLGIGDATSLITNIAFTRWGSEVIISCNYDPLGRARAYVLIFKLCTEVIFRSQNIEKLDETAAELIGLVAGEANYLAPAVITTDIFELSILYGSFELR